MRVAVLTARAPSGQEGGAERFYGGLVRALARSGVDAVEIPVPVDESNFDTIEEAYLACWDLDASAYDLVISTKAPTFMVRHPRHVCYLVHTIRVFYDMFDVAFPGAGDALARQRDLVHALDTLALSPQRTRAIFSIGGEVAGRLKRYNGLECRVMHPPLGYDAFHGGPQGDYVLLPGRLHPWKRVALAIEAMRHVKSGVRLVIAGSGEQEAELRALASGLPSVSFAGRVDDAQLVRLYAGALAVAFVPIREDYGYVTLEAFKSAKPVVTCSDSGESAAIVRHGVSGIVAQPNPAAIAAALDAFWADRGRAAEMGLAGERFVAELRWDRVVETLLAA